ncbi:hypothetical protein [Agrobacterium larrymoorei]|uniref:hypothetical protein n=1 Tax=Agrobacterium larrymoorei TaxID=160699 RepID=UPI0030BCE970
MTDFRTYADEFSALEALPDTARLDTKDAAKALQLMGIAYTHKTLVKLRSTKTTGPRYQKVGAFVFYVVGDLRAFAGMQSKAA